MTNIAFSGTPYIYMYGMIEFVNINTNSMYLYFFINDGGKFFTYLSVNLGGHNLIEY
jgi:hypothetical protein